MTALVELGQEAIRSISAELHKHPAVWMFRQDAQFDGEMRQEAVSYTHLLEVRVTDALETLV